MQWLLNIYQSNETLFDLIDSAAGVLSLLAPLALLIGFWRFLRSRRFEDKRTTIERDLNLRSKLGEPLRKYVLYKEENGIKDIGVRFVYWNNYPYYDSSDEDDGFKHLLWVDYHDSWIDNTGVYFQEHPWFNENSVYLDKNNFFFVSEKGKNIKGFEEIPDSILVFHLPFAHIVNFDFKEFIGYEPVFYTKYKYRKKSMYSDKITIRSRTNKDFSRKSSQRKWIKKKYSWTRYIFIRCKFRILALALSVRRKIKN